MTVVYITIISLVLKILDYLLYSEKSHVFQASGSPYGNEISSKKQFYHWYDWICTVMVFIHPWLDIFILANMAARFKSTLIMMLVVFLAGSRYRLLQETAHTALHRGLCRSKLWQWGMADFFFQFVCFKPTMKKKFITHIVEHHRHPGDPKIDPNMRRFEKLRFQPGMSKSQFIISIFHPFSYTGLRETIQSMYQVTMASETLIIKVKRAISIIVLLGPIVICFNWTILALVYIIPMLTAYPWFSWVSLLVEHRWFAECDTTNRISLECTIGRPTNYSGISGFLVRHLICPLTDSYHLAHSIYPFLRWNYLPQVDNHLKLTEPRYATHSSHGLIYSPQKFNKHSALSELYARMTKPSK